VDADSTVATSVSDKSVELGGASTLYIEGNYEWFGNGNWTGTGKMNIVANGGQLRLDVSMFTDYALGRTIDNFGTVTWSQRDISVSNGANIINEKGATFTIAVDSNIVDGGTAGSFENNAGALLQKTAGNGTTRIDLVFWGSNRGKIQQLNGRIKFALFIQNAGILIVSGSNGGMDFLAGFEQDSGSTSIVANTATITVAGGNMVVKGGTVSASGNTATGIFVTGQYQQSGGTSTPGAYSTFSATDQIVESGGTIELQGGTL
jgi:hypothetical protein